MHKLSLAKNARRVTGDSAPESKALFAGLTALKRSQLALTVRFPRNTHASNLVVVARLDRTPNSDQIALLYPRQTRYTSTSKGF